MHLSRGKRAFYTVRHGIYWLSRAKIWDLVPVHMKNLKTLSTFKNQIKKWIPKDCPCRLCRVYVAQVGFL